MYLIRTETEMTLMFTDVTSLSSIVCNVALTQRAANQPRCPGGAAPVGLRQHLHDGGRLGPEEDRGHERVGTLISRDTAPVTNPEVTPQVYPTADKGAVRVGVCVWGGGICLSITLKMIKAVFSLIL